MKADMWPMFAPTTMSMPFIEMPQRDEAFALDDEQAAAAGGAGRLAGVALDDDPARHHVLGDAGPASRARDVACWFMPAQ
jgi:hypothetical protein